MSANDEIAGAATVTAASEAGGEPTVPGRRVIAGGDEAPTRIGRYRVQRRLGAGGMGVVYAAHDPELDRTVAIKLVRDRFDGNPALEERLKREAQALARLQHPNVVAVYDVGVEGDRLYIVMQYVDGAPLDEWMRATRATPAAVVKAFEAAGRGLHAAHSAGLVHRDFKPGNVLVEQDGTVRVSDFGLARLSHLAEVPLGQSAEVLNRSMTSNDVVGTPAYMAPEQFLGGAITAATDQFGYCVSLWEALAGTRPFAGESFAEIRKAVVDGELADAPRVIPRRIARALRRGLSRQAADRHPDMRTLLDALAPPRRWWIGGVAAVALAGAGATAAMLLGGSAHANPCRGVDVALDAVWGDAQRAAVGGGVGGAGGVQALDERAATWRMMRIDACEADRVRHVEDDATMARRDACLDRALAAIRAAADLLASPGDPDVHASAGTIARSGTDAKTCTATGTLTSPATTPSDDLLRRVAELDARSDAGDSVVVLRDGPGLAQALEDAGDPADAARAWFDVAAISGGLPTATALTDARKAAALAAQAGDDARAALAWATVADLSASTEDTSGAEDAIGMAQAAASRSHDDGAALYVTIARGGLEEKKGNYDEAEKICKEAAQHAKDAGDALYRDQALGCLAQVYLQTGRHQDELPIEQEILDSRRQSDGDDAPLTLDARLRVALCRFALGDRDAARAEFKAVTDRIDATVGADSLAVMDDWSDIAETESEGGNIGSAEALTAAQRALAIGKKVLPADDPRLARLYAVDAGIEYNANQHDLSEREYEAALAIYERLHDLRTWASTAYNASDVYRLDGNCARASTMLERVASIADAGQADQLAGAAARAALGDCQVKLGKVADGIATMTVAVKDLDALDQTAFAAQYRLEIAEAYWQGGDRASARQWAQQVKDTLTDGSETGKQMRQEADDWYLKPKPGLRKKP